MVVHSATATTWRPRLKLTNAVAAAAVAASSAALGVLAAAIGGRFGPAAVVVLTVMVGGGAAVFADARYGVLAVLSSVPLGLQPLRIGLVVTQAVIVFVFGVVVVRSIAHRCAPIAWSPVLGWGVAVILVASLSLGHSQDTVRATNQLLSLVVGLALVMMVSAAVGSVADVRQAVHVLLAVGTGICLLSLRGVSALNVVAGGRRADERLHGTFTEPNQFGCFSAIVLVVALAVLAGARTGRERLGALVAMVSAVAALGFTLSRGAWIGAGVGMLVLAGVLPRARRVLAAITVLAAVALGTAVSLGSVPPEVEVVGARLATLAAPADNPYDDRPAIWAEARREIVERPWTGHGPGQFPVVSERSAGEGASASAHHAHNVLLTVAAEIGLVAAVLVVAMTVHLLRLLVRTVRQIDQPHDAAVVAGVGAGLSVIVGQGLVDFTLRNAVIFAILATLLGLLLGAARTVRVSRG